MGADEASQRLSDISTRWSLLFQVQQGKGGEALPAWGALMQRYCGAAYRYLLAVTHDPHVADDLVQEFALRFLGGEFKNVSPERGRFRDYLKTVLYHLLVDHRRRRRARPGPLPAESTALPQTEPDAARHEREFLDSWREELLNRAWEALAGREEESGVPYFTVLRWRAENPAAPAARLAEELTARSAKAVSEAGVRQILHRARGQFADLLLEDVSRSLGPDTADELEEELASLNLLRYCRPALDRRKRDARG
jgi:RNA polymerase sigma-70 factor (ECF subfamily)